MARTFAMIWVVGLTVAAPLKAAAPAGGSQHLLPAWQYYQEAELPRAAEEAADAAKYCDFILPPSVFDKARVDLGDFAGEKVHSSQRGYPAADRFQFG